VTWSKNFSRYQKSPPLTQRRCQVEDTSTFPTSSAPFLTINQVAVEIAYNVLVNIYIMGCDAEAVAVSVLLEMKQTYRSSFNSKVSAFLNFKQAGAPFTAKVAGYTPQESAPLLEQEQQIHSGKRGRQKNCSAGSNCLNTRKKPRWNVGDTMHKDSKRCQASSLNPPVSVASNLPAISHAPNLPMPSLPLNSLLPCTFAALVKQSPVLPSSNPYVEKSDTTFLPGVESARTVAYVPAADVSAQLLQQLFSLVNLVSPQELALALLVAELKKMSTQSMAQQKAEISNFLAFLPTLMPLLHQQLPTFGKSASPAPPPKLDITGNNAAMTWVASLLLQACTNTLS
jgi:hypothetical protein